VRVRGDDGHILAVILSAVIFGAAKSGSKLRVTGPVIVVYLGVSLLNTLWDSVSGISSWLHWR
jgi:hypothetical protein